MIPAPTPVVISELLSLLDIPVGTEVSDRGHLPTVRVTKTGDAAPSSTWEATPLFQVEVWSQSEAEAEDIAYDLRHRWPDWTAHRVAIAGMSPAVVHGRWVEIDPSPLTPPDDTTYHRYALTLGVRMTGST